MAPLTGVRIHLLAADGALEPDSHEALADDRVLVVEWQWVWSFDGDWAASLDAPGEPFD